MDGTVSNGERSGSFRTPERFLAGMQPDTAAEIIAAVADVALVVEEGVIQDVALGSEDLTREGYDESWRGQPWIDTVTIESRPKISDLLEGEHAGRSRWRQVNHPSTYGMDVPVQYTSIKMAGTDRLIAVGRDLRAVSLLQQRLVEAHQNLERDYSHLRHAESRYRLLFQSVSQPVLVAHSETREIEEANPAVAALVDRSTSDLIGGSLDELFEPESRSGVGEAVLDALASGRAEALNRRLRGGRDCDVSVSAFRSEDATRVVVVLRVEGAEAAHSQRDLLRVLEELPDGFVVAGSDLRVLAANPAFVDMGGFAGRGQAVGSPLAEVLGRSATDFNVLVSNLKSHGVVRNFGTIVRSHLGGEEEVEVSGVATPLDDTATYGFTIRSVARRLRVEARIGQRLPSSADQLTGLVGRVPLREIVRESTDLIEKLCIEAALEITDDNRASAAEMLGLSRQGLYSKLRRFGHEAS